MSQIPSESGTDRRRSLSYDELIALFVAFLTLGSVLFWGLTRSGVNLFGRTGLFDADGAPSVVGNIDGNIQALDLPTAELDDDDDVIGFGTSEALGAAGATGAVGGIGQALDRGSQVISAGQTTPIQPATTPDNTDTAETPPEQEIPTAEDPAVVAAEPEAPEVPEEPIAAPLEVTQEALKFQDVPDDYWAKPYIDALSERDVFDGIIVDGIEEEDSFKPDEPISRAQLARAITKAFPLSDEEAAINFSDVAADFWALSFINEAVKGGYMNGFPDGSFKPDLPVPRVQAFTAMVTGSKATVDGAAADVVQQYTDANDIQNWAVPKVAAATQAGLVVNHPDLSVLNPNQPATRAEVAAMIYQTLVAQGRIEPIEGEYIVKP
ncbi:MAG: S-layer homology domain-containing protein [Cyanobacteria bacterium P01_D01_bin.156]